MSLLDDVRRMAEDIPTETDRAGFGECYYCSAPNYEGDYLYARVRVEITHKPDCPILSMPKILAVLEAAEAVTTIAYEEERIMAGVVRGSQFVAALEALDATLDA